MRIQSVAIRFAVFMLLAGMFTNVVSAQYRDTLLGDYNKCLDEAYLELNDCLAQGGYFNDFKCDRAFELNEARCDLELLGKLVWPW